jgi:hypothetical protein
MVLYTNDELTARAIANEVGTHFEMHEQIRHAEEIFVADRQAEYDRWKPLTQTEERLPR